jgi:hypothetical protein
LLVLAAALGLALSGGHLVDAAIIGALLLLSLAPIAIWVAVRRRR